MAENDCLSRVFGGERGRVGDMIGQGGLEEVRVGLTCIRIRRRCEGGLGPAAADARGARDVCVRQEQVVVQLQLTGENVQGSAEDLHKIKVFKEVNSELRVRPAQPSDDAAQINKYSIVSVFKQYNS